VTRKMKKEENELSGKRRISFIETESQICEYRTQILE
jgi:hypothetical protein